VPDAIALFIEWRPPGYRDALPIACIPAFDPRGKTWAHVIMAVSEHKAVAQRFVIKTDHELALLHERAETGVPTLSSITSTEKLYSVYHYFGVSPKHKEQPAWIIRLINCI
jgi:hypothetical protein